MPVPPVEMIDEMERVMSVFEYLLDTLRAQEAAFPGE